MRRKTDRLAATCAVIAFLCLIVAVTVAWAAWRNSHRLEQASLGVCQRLQLQRERSNLSDARQFLILRQVLRSPRLTPVARVEYRQYVDSTEYGPPTDCRRAVDDPPSYRAPGFRPFNELGVEFAQSILDAAEAKRPQPTPNPGP